MPLPSTTKVRLKMNQILEKQYLIGLRIIIKLTVIQPIIFYTRDPSMCVDISDEKSKYAETANQITIYPVCGIVICCSIDRPCICFFEKYDVKTIVPTFPIVCATLSMSENLIQPYVL
ncbi:MAG TPA: hypothetical protein VE223_06790 [Nitrososphaeraceae archaeon]|nr:hypothetical protein [Nitrososphaeraceae archaeon]